MKIHRSKFVLAMKFFHSNSLKCSIELSLIRPERSNHTLDYFIPGILSDELFYYEYMHTSNLAVKVKTIGKVPAYRYK